MNVVSITNSNEERSAVHQWALWYFEQGWSVVPVMPGEKRPGVEWAGYQTERASLEQIESWWSDLYKDHGVGVITGAISGLIVIDVDDGEGKDGGDSLDILQLRHDDMPETRTVATGGGGRHFYFKHPGDDVRIKTGVNVLGSGIDVRGDGGFVVAPPTRHPCGKEYAWLDHEHLSDAEPAEMPAWLIELCLDTAQAAPAAVETPTTLYTGAEFNAFGVRVDGREDYMTRLVWARVLEEARRNPIKPVGAYEQPWFDAIFNECWGVYERACKARESTLEAEGRGPSLMRRKIQRAIKKWDGRVLAEAARLNPRKANDWGAYRDGPTSSSEPDLPGPFPASDFAGPAPERQWLVKDWLPVNTVVSLYGDGGTGKTLLAQQLAYAGAVGQPWLGLEMPKFTSLCVFCEDERDEIHRRHEKLKAAFGAIVGNPFGNVWLWPRVGADNLLVTFDRDGTPHIAPFFEAILAEVETNKIDVLILDTAADLFGGNEIVRVQVNYFLKSVCGRAIALANEQGRDLTVLILAHPSQTGRNTGTGESGSTSWNNAVRARLYLRRPEDENAHPDERILACMKANYAVSGEETELRLIWSDGAFAPLTESEHEHQNEALKMVIKREIEEAWDAGKPYKGKRSKRYLDRLMTAKLMADGHAKSNIIHALSQLKEYGEIELVQAKKDGKNQRGWRPVGFEKSNKINGGEHTERWDADDQFG